jgi:predicted nucleotidyltransferase
VDELALAPSERVFLEALNTLGVRYLVIGMSAALLQGARGVTEDVDLWFEDTADPHIGEAAERAGGFWISGSFGMRPPGLGGAGLDDRFDVVLTAHGLDGFSDEFDKARTVEIDGLSLRVLPLARILASKRAANRPKDRAQIPALEAAIAVEGEREDS